MLLKTCVLFHFSLVFPPSGMTHSWGTLSKPLHNPELYHATLWEQYQSFAAKTMIRLLHFLCPWTDIMDASISHHDHFENGGGDNATVQGLQFSLEQNFGEIEFDWDTRNVKLRAMGTNPDAPPLLMAQINFDQLLGSSPMSNQFLSMDDYQTELNDNRGRYTSTENSSYIDDQNDATWICLNHRGRDTPIQHFIGHVSSALILAVLVPLPIVLPLTIIAVLLLIRIRRWSRNYTCISLRHQRRQETSMMSNKMIWHVDWVALAPIRKNYFFPLVKQH
jgi:hypothetical protein